MRFFVLIAIVALLIPARGLDAQTPTSRPDTVLAGIKAALHTIARAQEIHYSNAGTYTSEVSVLKTHEAGAFDPNVQVEFFAAGKTGWAARARHPLSGQSCVYLVGKPEFKSETVAKFNQRFSGASAGEARCGPNPTNN